MLMPSMFSSSSCDSENSDDEQKVRVTTLSRKRSYSISKGCTTVTRESFFPFKNIDKEIEADSPQATGKSQTVEASASNGQLTVNSVRPVKRPSSKRFTRSHNEPCKKPESSDSEAASSNANSTDDSTDNDTDTENHCGIVLNYIKPLLDSDASYDDAIETVPIGWHTDHVDNTKVSSCSINCSPNDGYSRVLDNELNANDEQDSRRNGVDGSCETISNCADFTELSHAHEADSQQQQQENQQLELAEQTRTSFELDNDDSISRANEQFGPHSQPSSIENKLSIDAVDERNDYESISDKRYELDVEAEMDGACLQSNAVDDKTEACDTYVSEPHTIGRCESGELAASKNDCKADEADQISEKCQDFVIITIDTEDDDNNDHIECNHNNNSTENNHQRNRGTRTQTQFSQRQEFISIVSFVLFFIII